MSDELDVFCVFEGGGAKGVAHVGFLSALDSHPNYNVRGYAGTSAGAVVAALAAAGWKGTELYQSVDGAHKSEAIEFLATKFDDDISVLSDFIDPSEWKKIKYIRNKLAQSDRKVDGKEVPDFGIKVRIYCLVALVFLAGCYLASLLSAIFTSSLLLSLLSLALTLCLGVLLLLLGYLSGRYGGFASMKRPQKFLEALLQEKIREHSKAGVTFEDLEKATGRPLKVVAADLEDGSIRLFSPDTTPDILVSQAVTASACIPLIFKPVKIGDRSYCDGGIVSNLPAWAFDAERLVASESLTITCEISPPAPRDPPDTPLRGLRLFARLGITACFGSGGLNTRGLIRHIPLSAWASFNLLDFDKGDKQAELIETSREQAEIKMDLERSHRLSIEQVYRELQELVSSYGASTDSVRVAYVREVVVVEGSPAGYHLWNCKGFDQHGDNGVTLPKKGSLIEDAIGGGAPKIYDVAEEKTNLWYRGVGNGSFDARLPSYRSWVAIFPIPTARLHGRVSRAVCVDCGEDVNVEPDELLEAINKILKKHI